MKRNRSEDNETKGQKRGKVNTWNLSQEKWDIVYECETLIFTRDEAKAGCRELIALLKKLEGTIVPPIGANKASTTLAALAMVHDKRKFFEIILANGQHKYMCTSIISTTNRDYKINTPLMIATLGCNVNGVDAILANKYFRADPEHQTDIQHCIDWSEKCLQDSPLHHNENIVRKLNNARTAAPKDALMRAL